MNAQDKHNFRSKESLQNKLHLQIPLHSIIFVYTFRFISNIGTNLSENLKLPRLIFWNTMLTRLNIQLGPRSKHTLSRL
jgi:hypothetical protein